MISDQDADWLFFAGGEIQSPHIGIISQGTNSGPFQTNQDFIAHVTFGGVS